MKTDSREVDATTGARRWLVVLRYVALIAVLLLAYWAARTAGDWLHQQLGPDAEGYAGGVMMLGAFAYVGLLATPFVPGAEVGLALLAMFGAKVAPLIYVSTVAAMMLAYGIGRFLPIGVLERLLTALRMRRAAALVGRAVPLSQEERLAMLLEKQPKRAVRLALQYRYVALALAVNMPGNSIIGGGGGIMLLAGLSGVFSPLATILTVTLAVSPVPLAVIFMGL